MVYRSGFFENRRGTRLFFAEEQPDGPARPREAWLICSPILEEKNVAHGAFVTLARALATLGVRAVRIDYEGHGDSDGDTGTLGLLDWTDDVCDAARHIVGDGTPLVLMGCRGGALIAAHAAHRLPASRLVAWCPVPRGDEHVQDLLRLNLTTQLSVYKRVERDRDALVASLQTGGTVNIVGWTMGRRLLDSLSGTAFGDLISGLGCPVDVLDLVRRSGDAPTSTSAELRSTTVRVQGVPGLPFWIDGNYIDYQQAGLVAATTALAGSQPA